MKATDHEVTEAIRRLRQQRHTMRSYLELRLELDDMHGVQDAASDIREIDAKIAVLSVVLEGA